MKNHDKKLKVGEKEELDDITPLEEDDEAKEGKGLKILT